MTQILTLGELYERSGGVVQVVIHTGEVLWEEECHDLQEFCATYLTVRDLFVF